MGRIVGYGEPALKVPDAVGERSAAGNDQHPIVPGNLRDSGADPVKCIRNRGQPTADLDDGDGRDGGYHYGPASRASHR
jgi:hypothetical protein